MEGRLAGCIRLKEHTTRHIGGRDERFHFREGAGCSGIDANFEWRPAAAVENKVIDWIISVHVDQYMNARAIVVPTRHVKRRQ